VDVQGVRPPPAVYTVDVHGVFPPPAVWTFMRGVFPPQPAELEFVNNLWGLGTYGRALTFHHMQYERAGFTLFHLCTVFVNARMPDCPASGQSGTGWQNEKNADARARRYGKKGNQSGTGMVRYRTDMSDAGMSMPRASALMPVPSYNKKRGITNLVTCQREREQGAQTSIAWEGAGRWNLRTAWELHHVGVTTMTRVTYIICIEHPRLMCLNHESNPGPPALQANTQFEWRC
jgi:hypothetical protein